MNNSPVYDQFALMEQVGVINSARMMKILRNLRKENPIGEGTLAAKCTERMFYPEWVGFISKLSDWGWIAFEPVGHGAARKISLTTLGEEFLTHQLGPRVEEQPTEVTNGNLNG
jgi:hypothetical protein